MKEAMEGIDSDKLYEIVLGASHHVQNRVEHGLYNFLMGNSILVLAWATLFANVRDPMSGPIAIVLCALSLLGWASGMTWAVHGARMYDYMIVHTRQAREIERMWEKKVDERLKPVHFARKHIEQNGWGRWWISWSPSVHFLASMGFALMHVILLSVTIYVYSEAFQWVASVPPVLFLVNSWCTYRQCHVVLKKQAEQGGMERALVADDTRHE